MKQIQAAREWRIIFFGITILAYDIYCYFVGRIAGKTGTNGVTRIDEPIIFWVTLVFIFLIEFACIVYGFFKHKVSAKNC